MFIWLQYKRHLRHDTHPKNELLRKMSHGHLEIRTLLVKDSMLEHIKLLRILPIVFYHAQIVDVYLAPI